MSAIVDRFQKRQIAKAKRARQSHLQQVADLQLVVELLETGGDDKIHHGIKAGIDEAYAIDKSPPVSVQQASDLLANLRHEFDQQRFGELAGSVRRGVLESIAGPFGIGRLLHRYDKDGGPVTTPHNARQGVYSLPEDKARFEMPFDRSDYEKNFRKMRRARLRIPDEIIDAYTGRTLPRDGRMHLDHVRAAKRIHSDDTLRLATNADDRNRIANHNDNIVPTHCILNQSKKDSDLKDWRDAKTDGVRSNGKRFGVDDARADAIYERAEKRYGAQKTAAVAKHFAGRVGQESSIAAARMGLQQSVGLLLAELATTVFDEIRDIAANGFKGGTLDRTFMDALTERFTHIGQRLLARWADIVAAFKNGAIAGLLSTIFTMLINAIQTTLRSLVRIIREGGLSLLRAIKLLLNPPAGMSANQVSHEASKIILAGVAIVGGVALEEAVSKWVGGLGIPLAGPVTAAVVGIGTGLVTMLGVYMIDKIDLFGAVAQERQDHVLDMLTKKFNDAATDIAHGLAAFEPIDLITHGTYLSAPMPAE